MLAISLEGRRALVTGAGRNLGAVIARTLAEAGSAVAVVDKDMEGAENTTAALRQYGYTAHAFHCDVSDETDVARTFARANHVLGGVDTLVNNAGAVRFDDLETLPFARWREVVSVNLDGAFLCTQAFGRLCSGTSRPSIVNISSTAAIAPAPGRGAYIATKQALIGLTRQTAIEWGPRGIRANVVCVGKLDVGMSSAAARTKAQAEMVPSGRLGSHQDIGSVVAFLCSDLASYVNGATLVVDGGLTITAHSEMAKR